MENLKPLIEKIKQKRELSGLSDSVVSEFLEEYIDKHRINLEKLNPSEEKIIITSIRAELRRSSGMFQESPKMWKKRKELLEQGKIEELLKTHSSTRERLEDYPKIISLIKELNVSSILDLGCGLNPIAISSELPKIKYCASDIREDELELVKEFFAKKNIDGETFILDLRKLRDFPKADICLIFKVLDIIEKKGHKLAEEIIKAVPCRYLLISFPTIKLSGKPMNFPRRAWIELLFSRLGFSFKSIKAKNEIFYLAEKPQK